MKTYIQSAIVCLVFAFIAQASFAQSKNIVVNGTIVVDSDNSPLPGANVTMAGTPNGFLTDADGKFSLSKDLRPGQELVFSFVGFVTQKYVITEEATQNITIRMKDDNIIIEEIASNDHYTVKSRRGILAVLKGKH